ncbi:MAG TPA: PIN domain protein, partial [Candidatus Kapabacteria bacterium]
APKRVREIIEQLGPDELTNLPVVPEVEILTDRYMNASIVTKKYREDAAHIANATVHRADVLVSWNFRHIVNLDKIRRFNAINRASGYPELEIRSPRELIYGEEKKDI